MDSRERVRLAFAHKEPDHVPLFEIHIDARPAAEILGHWMPVGYSGESMGVFRNKMIIEGRVAEFERMNMTGRIELLRKLGHDIIRVFPHLSNPPVPEVIGENVWRLPAIIDGHALTVWQGDGKQRDYWTIWKYLPETDSYLDVDSSLNHVGFSQLEQMVEELEAHGSDLEGISYDNLGWVGQTAPDVCKMGWADVPFWGTCWMPLQLEAMAARPELMDRYFAAYQTRVLAFLEAQLKRGADLILGGQDFCETRGPMFSPRYYKRWFQPFLLAITAMCHRYGVPYLRHEDGQLGPLEEVFLLQSGIDGWHAIEPKAGNDILYFKKKYGDKITLAGNVDCAVTLVTGTPEDAYNETRDKILRCAPGGGYILSSSNGIHAGVPVKNYLAMIQAWKDYGTYPIRTGT